MGQTNGQQYPGLVVVGAQAGDFALATIDPTGNKKDRDYIGPKLQVRYGHLVEAAETGMRLIERQSISLNEPVDRDIDETMAKLRGIYSAAYGWDAPEPSHPGARSRIPEPHAL